MKNQIQQLLTFCHICFIISLCIPPTHAVSESNLFLKNKDVHVHDHSAVIQIRKFDIIPFVMYQIYSNVAIYPNFVLYGNFPFPVQDPV